MSAFVGLGTYVSWIRSHVMVVLCLASLLLVVTVSVIYHLQYQENESQYQARIAELEQQTSGVDSVVVTENTETNLEQKQFLADTFFFYSAEPETVYLELDLNRKQNPDGTYLHYYYLHGVVDGMDVADYLSFSSSDSNPQVNGFLQSFSKSDAPDASTRHSYTGSILIHEKVFSFETDQFKGDFVTKDDLDYTRLQSVESAEVSYDGFTTRAFVVAEKTYGADFSKKIFFSGHRNVESATHQFVLWDELGNFYLLDNSDVSNAPPEYPSHTWLLYKNAQTDQTKKSFTATLNDINDENKMWNVAMSEFSNAQFEIEADHYIDRGGLQSTERIVVSGTVRDNAGVRKVSGFLHHID